MNGIRVPAGLCVIGDLRKYASDHKNVNSLSAVGLLYGLRCAVPYGGPTRFACPAVRSEALRRVRGAVRCRLRRGNARKGQGSLGWP